ncbi:hypothetical protein SAMN05421736_11283 [Evansella caseinilytica]|uniref:Uncharacterized protein n=1 Tax=Evansella caseinilytica TaxID=1503961 RepID=A0A1H3SWL4_9BACI|nr:hypothetical protein SAMN05421736_11283 [Evansella caseinilytica]
MDEKISSLFYFLPAILTRTIEFEEQVGYANGARITDENHAVNVVDIPVMNDRNVYDLKFYQEEGMEYLQAGGWTYIDEGAVKPIYAGVSSIVTIPSSDNARWFKIGEKVAGRTMAVHLPPDGVIVFGGEAGDIIRIAFHPKLL